MSYWAAFQLVVLAWLSAVFLHRIAAARTRSAHSDGNEDDNGLDRIFPLGICIAGFLFILGSGGDWMGHARFVVPLLPLLVVQSSRTLVDATLSVSAAGTHRQSIQGSAAVVGLLLLCSSYYGWGLDFTRAVGLEPLRSSGKLIPDYELSGTFSSWDSLDARLIALPRKHRHELSRVLPIYEEIVPELRSGNPEGELTVVTDQAGFFPYMLKKRYPDQGFYIIDLHGLCTREIAEMGLDVNLGGVAGAKLADIFTHERNPLADFVKSKHPDIVFVNHITNNEKRALENFGFTVLDEGGSRRHIAYRPVRARGQ
jgi:hypothetical protein